MRSRKPWAQALHHASPAPMMLRRPPQVGQTTWNKLEDMGVPYPLRRAFNGTI